ncbi:MAG TPA: NAD(P)/FAD-dependent oxidoreductase [Candidatus Tectomicrobia bacterium]|nr:NAD(P)/FAD-dependent oxidoreductase [Candidatus Tectomicrobia bacterium]
MSVDAYTDVVVVGGGPAGSYCAGELAGRGFKTLLLEEHESVASKVVCTGIIGINAFEEFPLPAYTVVGTLGHMKAISRYGTELPYTPPRPIAYVVDKGAFNSALAAQANAAGALLQTSTRAHDLVIDDVGVHLHALVGAEQPLRVHARLAVLACGVQYHLTKHLGLGSPCEFLQGAQTDVPQALTQCTEVHLNKRFSREAFAWLVPLQSGHTRVGVMCARNARRALMRFLDTVAPQWREWEDIHIAAKPIAQMPLPKSYADRVLVIGEAAGQVKATTGGGIYYGLLAARLAADTISHAFSTGCFAATTLQTYERAWRSLLADELALGLSFRKLYGWIGDRQMDGILHYIARNGLKDLIRRQANFDWHRHLIVDLRKQLPLGGLGLNTLFSF